MRRKWGALGTFVGAVWLTLADGFTPAADLPAIWTAGAILLAAYGAIRYAGKK